MSYQHTFKKPVNFYIRRQRLQQRLQQLAKICLLLLGTSCWNAAMSSTMPAENTATKGDLPAYSELISLGQQRFHLRKMSPDSGHQHLPVIVLLAGPNQNFHADSAWFALLQPLLAKKYQVLAIDRLGNGFSDNADDLSYRRFSKDLTSLLPALTKKPVILISFASASISAQLFHQQQSQQSQVQAMLWIDPDIATPEALALYQGYPVDWYQKHLQQLLPELAKGVWNQRTLDKLTAERTEVAALLTKEHQAIMDWAYFDAISKQRQSPERQQQRAIEIANYAKDLDEYLQLPPIRDIPVSIIDSDFESIDIQALQASAAQQTKQSQSTAKTEANDTTQADAAATLALQIKALQHWQQQGSAWSKQRAEHSGGQYVALSNSHHLVMFQHPQKIIEAVDWLSARITTGGANNKTATAMP